MRIDDMNLFALGRDISFLVSRPRRPSKDELKVVAESPALASIAVIVLLSLRNHFSRKTNV